MPQLSKIFLLLMAFSFLFCTPVRAEQQEDPQQIYEEQLQASGVGDLEQVIPDETQETLEAWGVKPEDPTSFSQLTPGELLKKFFSLAAEALTTPMTALGAILAAILLCAVAGVLREGPAFQRVSDYFGVLCILGVILLPLMASMNKVIESINICAGFMLAFIPVYAGILIACGKGATAAGYQSLVFGAAQLVSQLSAHVITPFSGCLLAVSVCGSLAPGYRLEALACSIKKFVTWGLGIAMTVFTGLLTLTGAINAAADSVGIRATKFLVGSTVPVVGGAVSEAVGSVQSCLSLLHSTVGGYGAIAMVVMLLPGLVEILLWKLVFVISAAVSDIFGVQTVSSLIHAINAVLSMLIAVIVCCTMLFVISITVMQMVGAKVG